MNTVLRDALLSVFSEFASKPLFSEERPHTRWVTYSEVAAKSTRLAFALSRFLSKEEPPYSVCIYSQNCVKWVISDFACAIAGVLSVGLHTSWPNDEVVHVLNETSAAIVIAGAAQLSTILSVAHCCPKLKVVLAMDHNILTSSTALLPVTPLQVLSLDDVFEDGSMSLDECVRVTGCFISEPAQNTPYATVIYSSGTTNTPKGLGVRKETWDADSRSGPFDSAKKVVVSCSPLAHGMDRGLVWQATYCGGRVGFAQSGEYVDLAVDVRNIAPGIFVSMPNIWNRLYSDYRHRIRTLATERICGLLGITATNGNDVSKCENALSPVLDSLEVAFNSKDGKSDQKCAFMADIQRVAMDEARGFLGPDVSVVGTGGDFTSDEVMGFLRECYPNATVVNSYGTTEVPGISNNGVINETAVEVRLEAPQDTELSMSGTSTLCGEIVCRTKKRVMEVKYWGNSPSAQALSAEAFRDGWYHTGDLGSIDPATGHLTIIGRCRDVAEIYLGGRSVWMPLSKIEPVFRACQGVDNVYVHSDRSQQYLIAVVSASKACSTENCDSEKDCSYTMLCRFRSAGRAAGLCKHEIPESVILTKDRWTVQSGDLSVTGKLRRSRLGTKYKVLIDAEYSRLEKVDDAFARFKQETSCDRSFDYINYDFTARPMHHKEDGLRLAEIYTKECEVIRALRAKGPAATARLKTREKEINSSISCSKEAGINECKQLIGAGDPVSAVDRLESMGCQLRLKHKELLDAQRASDPEVAGLMRAFASWGDKLRELADEMGIEKSIPYQITAGIVLKPPPPPGADQVNALPESEGLPSWRTECACCGDLIEWGSVGAGTLRYKCMECFSRATHTALSLCEDCYELLNGIAEATTEEKDESSIKANSLFSEASERVRSEIVPCFALKHSFVKEPLNTLWIREKIFLLDDHCLSSTVARAFEWYAGRPCIGEEAAPESSSGIPSICWTSYRDLWSKACCFARGLVRLGVPRGAVMCLAVSSHSLCSNVLTWPTCEFGSALAGCALCVVRCCSGTISLPPKSGAGTELVLVMTASDSSKKCALPYECRMLVFENVIKSGSTDGSCACCGGTDFKERFLGPDDVFAVGANPRGEFVAYKTAGLWKMLRATPEFDEPYVQAVVFLKGSSVTVRDRLRLWDTVLNGGRLGVSGGTKGCSVVSPTKVVIALTDPFINGLQVPQTDAPFEERSSYVQSIFGTKVEKVVVDTSYVSEEKESNVNGVANRLISLFKGMGVELSTIRGFAETGYITKDGRTLTSVVLEACGDGCPEGHTFVSAPGMSTEYYGNENLTKRRFVCHNGSVCFVAPSELI